MTEQDKLDFISSYISKLMRKNFGRGPQSCRATLSKKHLVVYIQGFITPMEQILIQQEQYKIVDYSRTIIINNLLNEIKAIVQVSLDVEVAEHYHDWNFPNNSGILIFVLEDVAGQNVETQIDIQKLELEIGRISLLVQKVPDEMQTYPISPTIFLVERKGIFIQIEKALIEKGFQQELKFTKDQLEKTYFHRDGRFEDIFNTPVKDIFLDWNFTDDKGLIIFTLENKSLGK